MNYTMAQCEMEQMKVSCPANRTQCVTAYREEQDFFTQAGKGCLSKKECSHAEELCANAKRTKEDGTTECLVTCCESDGDTPCNGATPKNNDLADAWRLMMITTMMAIHTILCS